MILVSHVMAAIALGVDGLHVSYPMISYNIIDIVVDKSFRLSKLAFNVDKNTRIRRTRSVIES